GCECGADFRERRDSAIVGQDIDEIPDPIAEAEALGQLVDDDVFGFARNCGSVQEFAQVVGRRIGFREGCEFAAEGVGAFAFDGYVGQRGGVAIGDYAQLALPLLARSATKTLTITESEPGVICSRRRTSARSTARRAAIDLSARIAARSAAAISMSAARSTFAASSRVVALMRSRSASASRRACAFSASISAGRFARRASASRFFASASSRARVPSATAA